MPRSKHAGFLRLLTSTRLLRMALLFEIRNLCQSKHFTNFLRFEINQLPGPFPILAPLHKGALYILNTKKSKSKSIVCHWKSNNPLAQWFYISHQYPTLISISLGAYSKYCFDSGFFFIRNSQLTPSS